MLKNKALPVKVEVTVDEGLKAHFRKHELAYKLVAAFVIGSVAGISYNTLKSTTEQAVVTNNVYFVVLDSQKKLPL